MSDRQEKGAKQHRRKHIPQRTCVVCRQKCDKRQLTRLVNTPEAGVVIDPTGKRNGRGAYLCDNPDCWAKAASGQVLNRALHTELTQAEKELIASYGPPK